MNEKTINTQEQLNRALLYGHELANGRYWFSIATHNALVNIDYATLEHQGYIRSYLGLNNPTKRGDYWQWDYEITAEGFARINQLREIDKYSFIAGEK